MKVIKKNLKRVQFNVDILKESILLAAREVDFDMRSIDLNKVLSDIINRIVELRGNFGVVSTYEIVEITYESLCIQGHIDVALKYKNRVELDYIYRI